MIYPSKNYTLYNPNISLQPDYSLCDGDRSFCRFFWHTNVFHSNGTILFSEHNITELDISNKNVIILISLDGIDWFDLGGDYLGGVLNNGDYCRINSDVNTLSINNRIEFTFGTGKYTSETSGNGWGIYFKIIFKSTVKTKYVGSLDLINWI